MGSGGGGVSGWGLCVCVCVFNIDGLVRPAKRLYLNEKAKGVDQAIAWNRVLLGSQLYMSWHGFGGKIFSL